jgi:hypothetical protein
MPLYLREEKKTEEEEEEESADLVREKETFIQILS